MMEWAVFIGFIGLCYFIGKCIEGKHYESIVQRESQLIHLPVITSQVKDSGRIMDVTLVTGNIVISGDFFKKNLAALINFFGGRVVGYESLIDRARRESVLRMKEKASVWGADAIMNMRFEMAKLDSMTAQSTGMFELLAYATAIKIDK